MGAFFLFKMRLYVRYKHLRGEFMIVIWPRFLQIATTMYPWVVWALDPVGLPPGMFADIIRRMV